jgi:hypothetical protein
MKRFYAIAVGVLLCAGWAISNAHVAKDTILIFNAEDRKFDPSSGPSLRSGGFVKVCIVNPNTFREKYTISLDGKDFHNIALPDALKGLIAHSAPGTVTVEEGVLRLTPNAGFVDVKAKLPPPFDTLYDDYRDRFKDFIDALLKKNEREIHADIGREMVEQIGAASTNHDAVCNVIDVVDKSLPLDDRLRPKLEDYKKKIVQCDCSGEDYLPGLPAPKLDIDKVFIETADNQINGLNRAYAALQKAALMWDLAYNRWSLFNQMGTPPVDKDSSLDQFMKTPSTELNTGINDSIAARAAKEHLAATETLEKKLEKFTSDIKTDINKQVKEKIEAPENPPVGKPKTEDDIRSQITQKVYGNILGSIEDANNRVKTSRTPLDAAFKVMLDSLNGSRSQLRRAADLFCYCLDQGKVPICITKTYAVPPSADVVRASIKVEQISTPFDALEQVDTKSTAQQITSDNPASSQIYLQSMPVYGRVVVDYSSGLVVTTLRNQNWFIGSDMKVQRGPGDTANLAVAGLAHLYKTSPNLVIPALTLGIALGDNTRFLAGATAVIDLNIARAMLTCGAAFGKVAVLNNHLDVGSTTTASPVPIATVQRIGMFFGLSFSINL